MQARADGRATPLQKKSPNKSRPLRQVGNGDAPVLASALANGGAARAGPASGPVEDVTVRFEVSDTGPGIAPEMQKHLFNKFETLQALRDPVDAQHAEQSLASTGLGLVVSQHIVRLMGGEITATAAEGSGACFRVTLPLVPAPVESRVPCFASNLLHGVESKS